MLRKRVGLMLLMIGLTLLILNLCYKSGKFILSFLLQFFVSFKFWKISRVFVKVLFV